MMGKRSLLAAMALLFFTLLDSVLAANSSGCGKSLSISSGTKTLNVNGKSRQYILTIPGGYDQNKAYKLIFGIHWLGGTMDYVAYGQGQLLPYYGLSRLAGNSVIFVAPQGLNNGWSNSGGEDISFMDSIINNVESNLCVDQSQRFATGWSFGGAMSYSIACSRASTFRGVAVISGAELSGCSGGNSPIAYFGLHGVRDSTLSISLGRGLRDRFVRNNGCQSQSPREPSQGSLTHVKTQYSGCQSGKPVWWLAFDAGHQAAPQDGSTSDSSSKTYLPGEIWSFFSQFSSSGGGGSNPTTTKATTTTKASGGGGSVPLYGQCGGIGWTGGTVCAVGTCKYSNDWYSQCLQ